MNRSILFRGKLAWLLAVIALTVLSAGLALAETAGTWGVCPYTLNDGCLTICAGRGADTNGVSPFASMSKDITSVVFEQGAALPEDASELFAGFEALTSADMTGLDVSAARNLSGMFRDCPLLTSADITGKTFAAETDLSNMFSGCDALTIGNLSDMSFAAGMNLSGMFSDCASLTGANLSGAAFAADVNLNGMFKNCALLTSANLSGASFSTGANLTELFDGCGALTGVVTSNIQFGGVEYADRMFRNCNHLPELDMTDWNTSGLASGSEMFTGCARLAEIRVGSGVVFYGKTSAPVFSLGSEHVYLHNDWWSANGDCRYTATQIAVNRNGVADTYTKKAPLTTTNGLWGSCEWNMTVEDEVFVFAGVGVGMTNFQSPWAHYTNTLKGIYLHDGVVMPENCVNLFSMLNTLKTVEFGDIDASNVTTIEGLFAWDDALEAVDLRAFAGSELTNLSCVFQFCYALETVNLTRLDWSHMSEAQNTFQDCMSLREIVLGSGVSFAPTGYCQNMFKNCSVLESLDLRGFDFRNVEDVREFLDGCAGLQTLKVSENFSFRNKNGQQQASLPGGLWKSQADGQTYYAGEIPVLRDRMADTYTYQGNDGNEVGYWGTCRWLLNSDGLLTIGAGTGESNTSFGDSPWKAFQNRIKSIQVADGVVMPENCVNLFSMLNTLKTVEFGDIDASNVTTIEGLFAWDDALEAVDLRAFAGSELTNLSCVFQFCYALETVNLTRLDWSHMSEAQNTFQDCMSLREIVLGSGVSFAPTGYCQNMFKNCSVLESLDLRGFDFTDVFTLSGFVDNCSSLRKVYLGEHFRFRSKNDTDIQVNLPVATWYSRAADDYFTTDQISSYRDGIADVYTRDADGDWGSCHWTLSRRKLSVGPGVGADTEGCCPWRKYNDEITELVFGNGIQLPQDASRLFAGMVNLESLTLGYLNTTLTVNYSGMFAGDASLTSLDVTGFNTSAGINFSGMFTGDASLTSLDVTGFNTSAGTDFSGMFSGMSGLTSLDVTGFDTSAGINFSGMFSGMTGLTSLNVTGFDTSAGTDFSGMFSGMSGLTSLDVTGFDTSAGINFNGMFSSMSSLAELDLSAFDTSGATDASDMFVGTTTLARIIVGNDFIFAGGLRFPEYEVSGHTDWFSRNAVQWMDADAIASLRSGVMDVYEKVAEGNWGSAPWQLLNGELTVGAGIGLNVAAASPWANLKNEITAVSFDMGTVLPADCHALLQDFDALEQVTISGADVSGVENLSSAFAGCSALQTLDLSGINLSNVTNLSGAFSGCSALLTLDLSGVSTGKVADMTNLFDGCGALRTVTLGEGFSFKGAQSAVQTTLPGTGWRSGDNGEVYTPLEIAENRGNLADTYIFVVDLSSATVTLEPIEYTYDGESHQPTAMVTLNGTTLTESQDYALTFPEDTIHAATLTVTVTGIGGYIGGTTAEYVIAQADLSGGSVALSGQDPVYTGAAQEPELVVTLNGVALAAEDYTAAYADNVNAGTATVTVTGVGDYTGVVEGSFTIQRRSIVGMAFTAVPQTLLTAGEAVTPPVVVPEGVTCEISYADNIAAGTGRAIVTGVGNYTGNETAPFTILAREDADTLLLPAALRQICEEAFAGVTAQLAVIPDGCASVGSRAFANCDSLIEIDIPVTVTSIAPDAFGGRTDFVIRTVPGSAAAAFAENTGIYAILGNH